MGFQFPDKTNIDTLQAAREKGSAADAEAKLAAAPQLGGEAVDAVTAEQPINAEVPATPEQAPVQPAEQSPQQAPPQPQADGDIRRAA